MSYPDKNNHLMDRSFLTASISDLVGQLTFEEKRLFLAGDAWWHTTPVPRLNIPSVKVSDGPAGVRGGSSYAMTPTTSFPNGTCLGATFDISLVRKVGQTLAKDAISKKISCVLGPTMNIQRSPLGGRAFESFSEDPTLSGHLASAYISGLQELGVSATPKHFVCNDQESDRMAQDSIVAPRPFREVYLRPFQIAHRLSRPMAMMTGYNKVNGLHCSESEHLLNNILRKEWGFQGIVMSDYGGTYSAAEALIAGLDLEMPGPAIWRNSLIMPLIVEARKLDMDVVNTTVTRILSWVQKLARANPDMIYNSDKTEQTRYAEQALDSSLVRALNTGGIVVLKNDTSILPLRTGNIAVIGPNAHARTFTGGGSARLLPAWFSTIWNGMQQLKPDDVSLSYSLGCATHKFLPYLDEHFRRDDGEAGFNARHYPIAPDGTQAKDFVAEDRLTRSEMRFGSFYRPGLGSDWFTEIHTTLHAPHTGEYDIEISVTGKYWLYVDDELKLEMSDYKVKGLTFYGNGTAVKTARIAVEKDQNYRIRLVHDTREPPNVQYLMTSPQRYTGIRIGAYPAYDPDQAMEEAVTLAKASDIAVVVCGLNEDWESEGDDRLDLSLPLRSNELIAKVYSANPNTIVVIQGGGAVSMPWLDNVRGVVQAWYGGSETGTSVADILYGHVNPSGRLPVTIPKRNIDCAAALSFKSAEGRTYYEEGIWVGYKHHTARQIEPLFAFGHGLSYTVFEYHDLAVVDTSGTTADDWTLTATVTVRNVGDLPGSHSIHAYLSPPPELPTGLKHPEWSLQAFEKVHDLQPKQEVTVKLTFDKYAISHWDETRDRWSAESGLWRLAIGRDADHMVQTVSFSVPQGIYWSGL